MPHPSRVIRGVRSRHLEGRRIVLGVSGSIAAVEAPRIARELLRHGADVVAVMTREAARIVTPEAMAFATGHPAISELSGDVEHVSLLGPGEGRADLLLIAPATANTLSKIAHGIDDTPVTSCASVALGGGVPVLLAPAMHGDMARNPAIRENLRRLRRFGVELVDPVRAEGEEKIAPPEVVAAAVVHRLASGPLARRSVIVIGGASREPIDEVRSVTNESSGATAVAIANEAYLRGASVTLWAGAIRHPPPSYVPVEPWTSVSDLLALGRRRRSALRASAAILVPAALSDFTAARRPGKIESRGVRELTLTLRKAPKALPELRRLAGGAPRLVGFKLEAGKDEADLEARALELLAEARLDAVVANRVSNLGGDRAEVLWLSPGSEREWIRGTKPEVAAGLLDRLESILPPRAGGPRRRRGAATSSPSEEPPPLGGGP